MGAVLSFIKFLPWLLLLGVMLVCGLIGLFRGLKKTVGSLVVIAVSFILSLIVTSILCNPQLGVIESMFSKVAGNMFDSMNLGAISEIEAFSIVSKYYVAMLIGPFVFMVLFFVFRFILGIIMRIFIKKIPIMKKLPTIANRLGGFGAGMVVGFLVVLMVMAPILGTINVANVAVTEMAGAVVEDAEGEEEVSDVIGSITDKGAFKVIRVLGGDAIYNMTSNKRYNGQKVTLATEIKGMSHLLSGVAALGSDFSNYGDSQANAFGKIADATEESPLISLLSAECISSAAEKWRDGEEFMGVSSIGGNEPLVQPLMNAILDVFKTTDEEHLGDDLRSIGDAFTVLNKYELFTLAGDKDAMLNCLNTSPILSEMAQALHSNPRMSEVEKEVSSLGMRAFANVVGIPQEGDENYEEYNKMTESIAQSINNSAGKSEEEKREMVKSELQSAATDYEVNVEGEVADQITDKFIEEFGHRDDVTDQEVKDFIAQYQNDVQVQ